MLSLKEYSWTWHKKSDSFCISWTSVAFYWRGKPELKIFWNWMFLKWAMESFVYSCWQCFHHQKEVKTLLKRLETSIRRRLAPPLPWKDRYAFILKGYFNHFSTENSYVCMYLSSPRPAIMKLTKISNPFTQDSFFARPTGMSASGWMAECLHHAILFQFYVRNHPQTRHKVWEENLPDFCDSRQKWITRCNYIERMDRSRCEDNKRICISNINALLRLVYLFIWPFVLCT